MIEVDTVLLAMAMAALGLATHSGAIRKADIKPLVGVNYLGRPATTILAGQDS